MDLSDDDYDHVSDIDMCDSESERPNKPLDSAPSSPPSLHSSQRKMLACSYQGCHKTFNRRSRLEEHIRSHENIRPFKCPYPDCTVQPYLRQSHLNHHIKNAHSGVRDYRCTWEGCGKSFATGTRLRRHLAAHEGREKYRCRGYEGCSEVFRKHETLKRHILSVHQQMRPYPCTESDLKTGRPCSKAFDTMEKLRAHQRSAHDPSRFSCADCLLAAEKALNDGGEDLSSDQAYFATYSELQAHIAEVHPPTCQYCPTSFKTVKELNRHLEVQHGWIDPGTRTDSKFACEVPGCGRLFTKRGNLNVHIRTVHDQKKDFVCGETTIPIPEEVADQADVQVFGCGRAFTSKQTLIDHVRSAHLGLTKILLENRNKRKAEDKAARQADTDYEEPKKRTRKDKGVKKTSTLANLTGLPSGDIPQGRPLHDVSPRRARESFEFDRVSVKAEDEGDNDDWNQLSGSMVMFGSHIYHNGQEYQYTHGQYPPGLSQPEVSNGSPRTSFGPHVRGTTYLSNYDDEPVFDNFEHEPELMSGLSNVDPVLLRS